MPSTFSTSLKLELIGNGEQAGVWGTTTNNNLGTLLEQAITGVEPITLPGGDYTLTNYNGLSDQARNAVLVLSGSLASPCNVIAPSVNKTYIVRNFSGATVTIKTSSGNGVALTNAASAVVFCNGTDFYSATTLNYIDGNLTVTGTTALQGAVTANSTITANSTVTIKGDVFANSNTGQFYIPTGNTSQRTSSPINGVFRYNTTLNVYEGYANGAWVKFVVANQANYAISYLVVAGGGAGGATPGGSTAGGGGGGAGGVIYATGDTVTTTSVLTITVGAGGTANGGSGGNSSISGGSISAIAIRGGGGGNQGSAGVSGGSGGGSAAGGGAGGSGTVGQGYAGGANLETSNGAGGGGGAAGVGGNGVGNGGAATTSLITGSTITFAGGGGGSAGTNGCGPVGPGGTGGGGGAGNGNGGGFGAGSAASANSGSGGGGGISGGGAGGSGFVILSIPTTNYSGSFTGSPTITTSGANTILQFNSSGTYTT
jgi:hypothetical protein